MGRLICLMLGLITFVAALPSGVFGQTGEVRVLRAGGVPGQKVSVSVELTATGRENAVGFSLNFEPRVLSGPVVSIGSGVSGGVVNVNDGNAASGQIGVVVALAASQTIPAGVRQLITITFDIASNASARESQISFGDLPVVREVVDVAAGRIDTAFTSGVVKVVTHLQSPQILVVPNPPTVDDEIVVDVAGTWNDGCVPSNATVTRTGSVITLRTRQQGEICTQSLTPYRITRTVGPLPIGTYSLVFVHDDHPMIGAPLQLGGVSFSVQPRMVNSNAASYGSGSVAPQSIVALFGVDLATATLSASGQPLPTSLGGTTIRMRDAAGVERLAPLFFVSPRQINYQVPAGTATGRATITLTNGNGLVLAGTVNVASLAPGIFTVDGSGRGLISGYVERLTGAGEVISEQISRNGSSTSVVPAAIDLGSATDQVFLVFYGTGFRARSSLSGVRVNVGGLPMEVVFAGGIEQYAGLDQCNVRLDRRLMGRGTVEVEMIVDGKTANKATVTIK